MADSDFLYTCRACGAAYWAFNVPAGHCAITGDNLKFCDACGEIDNFKIDEVEYADN